MLHKNYNDEDYRRVNCVNIIKATTFWCMSDLEALQISSKQHYIHKQVFGATDRCSVAQDGNELGSVCWKLTGNNKSSGL
jgi:hypothetical protein